MPKRKPILCLDFDGVINSYASGWQGPRAIPDPPVPGALEFVSIVEAIEWPTHKPPALVTIDDRAIRFDGTWPELADLRAFKPWNKS